MSMRSLDLQFFRELEAAVEQEAKAIKDDLAEGRAADHADYRYRVGRHRGLTDVLKIARAINDKMLGRDEQGKA